MAKIPLLIPTVGVALGAWLGCFAPWWIGAILLLLFGGFVVSGKNYFASVSLMSLAAFVSAWVQLPRSAGVPIDKELYYSAVAVEVNASNTGSFAILRVDSLGDSPRNLHPVASSRVGAYVRTWADEIPVGARLNFKTKFERCTPVSDLPYETDPKYYLLSKRIFTTAIIKESDLYSISPPSGFIGSLINKVELFETALKRSDLSARNISFLCTVTLGDTSTLLPQYREVFSNSGLAHLLALSGMHVALIAWIISIALWPLKLTGRVWPVTVLTILFLWLYAVATGMSASVMRAVLMASIYALSRLFYRTYSPMNSLFASVIVLLILWPDSLFAVGFQLSVAAVASILLFSDYLNPISYRRKNLRKLFNLLAVPLAAMLGTAPFCAYYFHSLPLYFILSNFAASILLLPVMISGIALGISEMVGMNIQWLCNTAGWLCDAVFYVADWVSSLPGSRLSPVWIPSCAIVPAIGALILFRIWIKMKGYQWLTLSIGMFAFSAGLVVLSERPKAFEGLLFPGSIKSSVFATVDDKKNCLMLCHLGSENYESELLHTARLRYSNYTAAIGVDSIAIKSTLSPSEFLKWIHDVGSKNVAIATSDSLIAPSHDKTDTVYIASMPNEKLRNSLKSIRPKKILIGGGISPYKAALLVEDFKAAKISVDCSNNSSHFF